jgi:hypothetical protein
MIFLSMPPLLSTTDRVGKVRNPKNSKSFQTLTTISRHKLVFDASPTETSEMKYRASYPGRLYLVSFRIRITLVSDLTVETK